jgi:Rab3 GTPase-activating protein regulatory subunit C-terminus
LYKFLTLKFGIISDEDELRVDTSEVCPWWEEARKILSASTQPLKALTAAYVCRGACLKLELKLAAASKACTPFL